MDVRFWKYESIGNDFPIVHTDDLSADLSLSNLTIQICDRRFGVGGDGLLTLRQLGDQSLELRMFNPDGTEDFCGNGIRCAAQHAIDLGWVGKSFTIEHLSRIVPVEQGDEALITHIGTASYRPSDVPLRPGTEELFDKPVYWSSDDTVFGSALTTGSTHTIVPTPALPSTAELERLGPKIEHFEMFPARTSVIWSEQVSPNHLKIRIWERGVGETLGCGTGSSAAAVDYFRRRGQGGQVEVENPGGSVWVSAESWDAPISVAGEAHSVFLGSFRFQS